jgi:hypothetical protein
MMNHDFASRDPITQWTDGNISVFNGSSHAIEAGRKSVSAMATFPAKVPVYLWFCMDNPFDAVSIYAPFLQQIHSIKSRLGYSKLNVELSTPTNHAL